MHNKGQPRGHSPYGHRHSTQAAGRGEEARLLTTPPLLLLRLASMLSAWVVTGLFSLAVCWGEDRPMMLPRFSGCALGSAGIPPPAAAYRIPDECTHYEDPATVPFRDDCDDEQIQERDAGQG